MKKLIVLWTFLLLACGSVVAQPTCDDGEINGDETDLDCGGSCSPCELGSSCQVNTDCTTSYCGQGSCWENSCSDGIQNNDEEEIDCGGSCQSCDQQLAPTDDGLIGDEEQEQTLRAESEPIQQQVQTPPTQAQPSPDPEPPVQNTVENSETTQPVSTTEGSLLIGIALGVILIVFITLYYRLQKSREHRDGIVSVIPTVKKDLKKGYTKKQIRQSLRFKGWPQQQIDDIFQQVDIQK